MAQDRTIDIYGGIRVDKSVVTNPTTQLAADKFNRLTEDASQFSRTSTKIDVKFPTTATAAPTTTTVAACQTQWGTGSSYHPAIAKTATGTYTITFSTSYADALVGTTSDAIAETETLALEYARGAVMSSSAKGYVHCEASANVVTAYVYNTSDALSDLGGAVAIWVEAK